MDRYTCGLVGARVCTFELVGGVHVFASEHVHIGTQCCAWVVCGTHMCVSLNMNVHECRSQTRHFLDFSQPCRHETRSLTDLEASFFR